MTRHAQHRMHKHSLLAVDLASFSDRERMIVRYLQTQVIPRTDREIMQALNFTEPNAVRPRLSSLVDKGILAEGPSVRDSVTGRTVRTLHVVVRIQGSIFAEVG